MNLASLKILARAYVPQAKVSAIDDATLMLILNEGALDVGLKGSVLKDRTTFNLVAEQQEYELRLVAPKYLAIDKGGVRYLDGSEYRQIDPVTVEWLDENFPNWESAGSGTPKYYYIYADKVGFYPKPSASISAGGKIYYVKRPTVMANADADHEYPFEESTEMTQYAAYSDCVLDYWIWRARRILGASEADQAALINTYDKNLSEKNRLLNKRADITFDKNGKLQGPKLP